MDASGFRVPKVLERPEKRFDSAGRTLFGGQIQISFWGCHLGRNARCSGYRYTAFTGTFIVPYRSPRLRPAVRPTSAQLLAAWHVPSKRLRPTKVSTTSIRTSHRQAAAPNSDAARGRPSFWQSSYFRFSPTALP